jgi:hypothetical protein
MPSPPSGRALLCKCSGKRNFISGQNWEIQKIRGIIYLENRKGNEPGTLCENPYRHGKRQGLKLLYTPYIYVYI